MPRLHALTLGAVLLGLIGATPACAFQDDPAATRRAAADARLHGRYDDALRGWRMLADADAVDAAAVRQRAADRRALLATLVELSRYDEAMELGARYGANATDAAWIAVPLGNAQRARGRLDDAARSYARAAGGPDTLRARLALAELRLARGEREAGLAELDRFIDVYNDAGGALTSDELAAVAQAVQQLGGRDPRLVRDALRAYDAAIAKDSANLDARVALGELFLEKYNGPDAAATLGAVLRLNPEHPRALLAEAQRRYTDADPGATELVAKAIERAPSLASAHVFQSRLQLDVEDMGGAEAEARKALAVDSGSVEALALLAATALVRGDTAAIAGARQAAMRRSSRPVAFYATLADVAARNRRYADAIGFARQAVALDSTSARAQSLLGMNLMRTGDMAAARQALETAFAHDPYDVWTKNTLDLLDQTRGYRELATEHFRIIMDPREAELLGPYAGALAEEAYARFAARYGWKPTGPVRLEIYPRHADFSVRTVGLAGLGALGVSFGPVLAMDSPAARDVGEFNWGSTLWHEVAHTFTLGASDHRIPRWLSEGLSVYEERQARPGWGAEPSPEFLAAWKGGQVPPPSRLTDAFMRPAYPAQLIFGYVQASLVCELIAQDHGPTALPRLVRAYGAGLATAAAFQQVLGVTPQQFDARFGTWLRERYAGPLAAVSPWKRDSSESALRLEGPYADAMREAVTAERAGNDDLARRALERAGTLAPDAAGADSPRRLLAAVLLRGRDTTGAIAALTAHVTVDEDDYAAQRELADLRLARGDSAGAAAALEAALWASPYDAALHERLALLYERSGQAPLVVRERLAVLALAPVDEAEAHYQLARALHAAGQSAEARREVLRALEIAPAFERAQALLLTLRSGGRS